MRVCARVLAAALMTGAIAGAVAFPAFFGQGSGPHRVLLAPPASQLRTLRVPAFPAPAQREVVHRSRSVPRAAETAFAAVRINRPAATTRSSKATPVSPKTPAPAPAPAQ